MRLDLGCPPEYPRLVLVDHGVFSRAGLCPIQLGVPFVGASDPSMHNSHDRANKFTAAYSPRRDVAIVAVRRRTGYLRSGCERRRTGFPKYEKQIESRCRKTAWPSSEA